MLRILVLSVLLLSTAYWEGGVDGSDSSSKKAEEENGGMKSGDCASNSICTFKNCTVDSDCLGTMKCCNAYSGRYCVAPVFKTPCEDNKDCPGELKCCKNGACDSACHPSSLL
ncbi:WAP four-disulfide core domain protein 12-like isoform X2 [Rhinatrema bivittatum]|nr:WAP four-disulfide core domain protein 12-like isoform X2 [Rhinatrema bivittatum]